MPARWRRMREHVRAFELALAKQKDLARMLGCSGFDPIGDAIQIAQRCVGAESALKRLAEENEKDLAEAGVPGLSAAQIERLAVLAEQCGEVARVVCKVLRHGYMGGSPYGGPTHKVTLEREMGNVRAAIDMMTSAGDVRRGDVQHWRYSKRANGGKNLHHQG